MLYQKKKKKHHPTIRKRAKISTIFLTCTVFGWDRGDRLCLCPSQGSHKQVSSSISKQNNYVEGNCSSSESENLISTLKTFSLCCFVTFSLPSISSFSCFPFSFFPFCGNCHHVLLDSENWVQALQITGCKLLMSYGGSIRSQTPLPGDPMTSSGLRH